MNLLVALSYLAMTLSIYGLVRIATGSRPAAIVPSGLLLATPAIWTPFVQQGLYTRVFGIGFASVAVVAAPHFLPPPPPGPSPPRRLARRGRLASAAGRA